MSGDSGVACSWQAGAMESSVTVIDRGVYNFQRWAAIFQGRPQWRLLSFNCPWNALVPGISYGFTSPQGSPETHIQAKMCQTTNLIITRRWGTAWWATIGTSLLKTQTAATIVSRRQKKQSCRSGPNKKKPQRSRFQTHYNRNHLHFRSAKGRNKPGSIFFLL